MDEGTEGWLAMTMGTYAAAKVRTRLRYEGLPLVCFLCGHLGHPQSRCPQADYVALDSEACGPWMSLPTANYRRVHEFTLQPIGPAPPESRPPLPHRHNHHLMVASPREAPLSVGKRSLEVAANPAPRRRRSLDPPLCESPSSPDSVGSSTAPFTLLCGLPPPALVAAKDPSEVNSRRAADGGGAASSSAAAPAPTTNLMDDSLNQVG
ncbi:hypothetical protein LINGRAPRIM_LOCUS3340 [Linum grandiflorum]